MSTAVGGSFAGCGDDEVAGLYRSFSGRLRAIVRLDVRAPESVIEDACQFAWTRFVVHASEVQPEAAPVWLVRTAVHEALKLVRRDGRELSLEDVLETGGAGHVLSGWIDPEELVEVRERLDSIGCLPERQQRLVWLHGIGHSYTEMATATGYTRRTVERQLLRAKRRLRVATAG